MKESLDNMSGLFFYLGITMERKQLHRAWSMYDWANSAYQLVIVTAIFPIYYSNVVPEFIPIFDHSIDRNAIYLYALSIAYLLVSIGSPLFSSLADYSGNKTQYMKFFTYLGAISCASMFFFDGEWYWVGIIGLLLSTVGYKSSFVFYNAFLPVIANEEEQNRVSAQGYVYGYLGSTILLLLSLGLIMFPDTFGVTAGIASRLTFLAVGVWWIVFAIHPFKVLKTVDESQHDGKANLSQGFNLLITVFKQVNASPLLRWFLLAYFFLIMGVQTVFYSATLFGKDELKMSADLLIITMLVIQFVGALGAYSFAKLSDRIGHFKGLYIVAVVWFLVTFAAYFITNSTQYIAASFFIGLVMGGIQASTRSTYASLLPKTKDHASFFSFYDVMENVAIVIGTFTMGGLTAYYENLRSPILIIASFFIIGIIFLIFAQRNLKSRSL